MKKLQNFAAAYAGDLCLSAFALLLLYASFSAEPADAYLFPRLSSVLLAVFCLANAVLHFTTDKSSPVSLALCRRLAPGAAIIVLYVSLAETAGFYPASVVACFSLCFCYSQSEGRRRLWTSAAATVLVMGLVYFLFGILLQVHTPEAFWNQ